jgi:putative hemolysin
MNPKTTAFLTLIVLAALVLAACAYVPPAPASVPQPQATAEEPATAPETPAVALANPASQNCISQGGTLKIETRPDGGQFGVCYFEDNRQCEEWALMRGECPVGGVKVTGYVTEAARFCAISGGEYKITANSGQADEQGTCMLKDGRQCDAVAFYNGGCEAAAPASTTASEAVAALQPPPAEVCDGMAQALAEALTRASAQHETIEVTQSAVDMTDPTTMAQGTGCRANATGTGVQFTGPDVVIKEITAVLTGGGWQEDPMLQAGGPTGMGSGYRSGDLVCLASAMWKPDASANCPTDKPISECKVTPEQQLYTITLDCAQETAQAATPGAIGKANPASQNCIIQGGALTIEERGDGGQFGVCTFADNQQCEEWALMRGQCPAGGVKVTGYTTPAARYCAITGGAYAVTGQGGEGAEQGTCTLTDGTQCDVWDYFNGKCPEPTKS